MGMMGSILGAGAAAESVGAAVTSVAEVFAGNRAAREAADAAAFEAAVGQYEAEFDGEPRGRFDGFVNALNRLPRPMLALSTLGLFAYAMAEPTGFSVRMEGLAHIPEPLWWLLGAIVSFYFGARELHYLRDRTAPPARLQRPAPAAFAASPAGGRAAPAAAPRTQASDPNWNAALDEWRRLSA